MTQEEIVKELEAIEIKYQKCAETVRQECWEKFAFHTGDEYVYVVFAKDINKLLIKIKQQ